MSPLHPHRNGHQLLRQPLLTYCQQVCIASREKALDLNNLPPARLGSGQQPDAHWQAVNVPVQAPTLIDGEDQMLASTIFL